MLLQQRDVFLVFLLTFFLFVSVCSPEDGCVQLRVAAMCVLIANPSTNKGTSHFCVLTVGCKPNACTVLYFINTMIAVF